MLKLRIALSTLSLIGLLSSTGATAADPAPSVSQLPPPAQQVKRGGSCGGLTLKDLGCTPKLNATSVVQIYEQGWRVVSHLIDSYGYHRLIIEEQ